MQVARSVDSAGSPVTRTDRSVVPLQLAAILAGLAGESWYSPHGGLALTTRPGSQVAVNEANRVPGAWAPIRYTPAGTPLHTTPPSSEDSACVGSGITWALK